MIKNIVLLIGVILFVGCKENTEVKKFEAAIPGLESIINEYKTIESNIESKKEKDLATLPVLNLEEEGLSEEKQEAFNLIQEKNKEAENRYNALIGKVRSLRGNFESGLQEVKEAKVKIESGQTIADLGENFNPYLLNTTDLSNNIKNTKKELETDRLKIVEFIKSINKKYEYYMNK